jgi:ATP-dependent Clp protease, protease subunit
MKRTADTNNILEEVHDYCLDFTNRQIYLHDNVKEECEDGIDFRVATRFIKNLATLESSGEAIVVHLFSLGGQCDAGFAIYDCIKTSSCHISVVCHGACMSMGTVILQAADERVSMPNCNFMFHEGSSNAGGTHKQTLAWSQHIRLLQQKTVDIYVDRCKEAAMWHGKTAKQIKNHIQGNFDKKEDWILTPEETLSYGFIDKILTEKEFKDFVQRT